jgi:hypothetical protein
MLLAWGFGAPTLLWGLGLASAPIIIHLLSRRRFREIEWAAMKWLLAALKQNARRIRIEQLILLAVRTLLVICVVMAMAKPFLEASGIARLAGRRTHHIVVLDGSFSMGYRVAGRDRFQRAKEVAAAILEDAAQGDAASLVLMASPPRVVVGESSTNLPVLQSELNALKLTHGRADLAATLSKVDELLSQSSLPRKEVYFVTDLQRASWTLAADTRGTAVREVAAKIAREAHLVVIDLGQARSDNLAVTAFELTAPFVTARADQPLSATLHNFGRDDVMGLQVDLLVDGELRDRRSIDLPAGSSGAVSFVTSFADPGPHWVEVRADDDPLDIDNHRWLALWAKEAIEVLCVDGEPSGQPFGGETDYLRVALAPEPRAGSSTPSPLRPESVHESEFLETELTRYDCVLLANLAQFSDSEARKLGDYLRRGGGVAWFLGDQVDAESYNRTLYRDGKGPLPARLGQRVGDPAARVSAVRFDPLDYAHPIVRPFRGAEQGGLLTTLTYAYVRAEPAPETRAERVLAFDTGDPAILAMPAEPGRVALVTTSADTEWTNWPFWPSYVPVIQELVGYLVADRDRDRNLRVGQTIAVTPPETPAEVAVSVELPGGEVLPRRWRGDAEPRIFLFDETPLSGRYRIRFGPPLLVDQPFAVNVDPQESDLRKLDRDELESLLPEWKVTYLTNWQAIAEGQSSVSGSRGELHRALLYAALALVFLESFLAWKFSHY